MQLGTVTVEDACRSVWTLQEPQTKQRNEESYGDELVTFWLTCGRCGVCIMQSECMPCKVNGEYNWLRQKSIRPAGQERVLIINHSLMQKARNDAPKKGGSNRIGQETSEIKRVKR